MSSRFLIHLKKSKASAGELLLLLWDDKDRLAVLWHQDDIVNANASKQQNGRVNANPSNSSLSKLFEKLKSRKTVNNRVCMQLLVSKVDWRSFVDIVHFSLLNSSSTWLLTEKYETIYHAWKSMATALKCFRGELSFHSSFLSFIKCHNAIRSLTLFIIIVFSSLITVIFLPDCDCDLKLTLHLLVCNNNILILLWLDDETLKPPAPLDEHQANLQSNFPVSKLNYASLLPFFLMRLSKNFLTHPWFFYFISFFCHWCLDSLHLPILRYQMNQPKQRRSGLQLPHHDSFHASLFLLHFHNKQTLMNNDKPELHQRNTRHVQGYVCYACQ